MTNSSSIEIRQQHEKLSFYKKSFSVSPFPHPPPPISLLANGQGYAIPYASEFYTTDQGYFMPQELCTAHAPICLHSEFGKNKMQISHYTTIECNQIKSVQSIP